MNRKNKIIVGIAIWGAILSPLVAALIGSCSKPEPIASKPSDEGLLLNDDLVAIKENDGNITIKNPR